MGGSSERRFLGAAVGDWCVTSTFAGRMASGATVVPAPFALNCDRSSTFRFLTGRAKPRARRGTDATPASAAPGNCGAVATISRGRGDDALDRRADSPILGAVDVFGAEKNLLATRGLGQAEAVPPKRPLLYFVSTLERPGAKGGADCGRSVSSSIGSFCPTGGVGAARCTVTYLPRNANVQ
jgi:hypothetical protein